MLFNKLKQDLLLKILSGITLAAALLFLFVYQFMSHKVGYSERSAESELYYIVAFILAGITLNYLVVKVAYLLTLPVALRVLLGVLGVVMVTVVLVLVYLFSSFALYYVF